MEAIALWVNRKPNKEFDLQMTGFQEVLFWYERTIISLQFFINLICRKYFRIQASMNTGSFKLLILLDEVGKIDRCDGFFVCVSLSKQPAQHFLPQLKNLEINHIRASFLICTQK